MNLSPVPADVHEISNRIRSECASARDRAETELGKGHPDLQVNRRYQPLRVVADEELLALNVASSESQDVDLLQKYIEHLAYNGYAGSSSSGRGFAWFGRNTRRGGTKDAGGGPRKRPMVR